MSSLEDINDIKNKMVLLWAQTVEAQVAMKDALDCIKKAKDFWLHQM